MPLQDLPCLSLQGSMLPQSKRIIKRKSRGCLTEGLDTECTPTELIQQWSPSHKHQRLIRGKENDSNQFVLARRSRRKKESISGRKHLSGHLFFSCCVLFVAMINCHTLVFFYCYFSQQAFYGTTYLTSCFSGSSSIYLCRTSSGCQ